MIGEESKIFSASPKRPAKFFHSFALPDGTRIAGDKTLDTLVREADVVFRNGVQGRSVIDIGAWDGYMSFEAERRGARSVLATDHFCWSGPGWGTREGFDFIHYRLRSKVLAREVDIPDLDPADLGTFDLVLFLGVLYHLRDPFAGLLRAAALAHDELVVETETACNDSEEPVMRFFPGAELDGDATNFWAPNLSCLRAMLQDAGFPQVTIVSHPLIHLGPGRGRVIAHARRS